MTQPLLFFSEPPDNAGRSDSDPAADSRPDQVEAGGATARILVVEDNAVLRSIVCEQLSFAEGVRTIPAANGAEALQKINADAPDLVITDLLMPDVDGIELCTRLRADALTENIPVIVITALGLRDPRVLPLYELPRVWLRQKPVAISELLSLSTEILSSAG